MKKEDKLAETIATYDRSAKHYAEYFRGIGPRVRDIEHAFKLASSKDHPHVIEIGCGDGRDAAEIIKRTKNYTGFDVSEGLLELAKQRLPHVNFVKSDARTFEFPEGIDVVFAFASLLHLDKDEIAEVIDKVHQSLNPGGVLYVSMKQADEYKSHIKVDEHGKRLFYLYHPKDLIDMAGDRFRIQDLSKGFTTQGNTQWFELAMQKV